MRFSVGRARRQTAPNSIARYRKRASECRAVADRSALPDERLHWLKLADEWLDLTRDVQSQVAFWERSAAVLAAPAERPAEAAPSVTTVGVASTLQRMIVADEVVPESASPETGTVAVRKAASLFRRVHLGGGNASRPG